MSSSPVFPDSVYFRDFFGLWEQMWVQQEHPAWEPEASAGPRWPAEHT